MSLDEPSDPTSIVALSPSRGRPAGQAAVTSFHRSELSLILGVYGRMLASGMARDYAIDHLRDRAVFSILRHPSEIPLYRVEKRPRDAVRQGAWSAVGQAGDTLKRGRDLAQVLKIFDRKLIRAVE